MADTPLPELIAGRYRPVRLIGKGGMGAVYEVEHIHTEQRLALKVLLMQPGASVERFKREARAASRIQSEHIVRVTDADVAPELQGAPFLVMELLHGADLERVTAEAPASGVDVVEWMRQVARGLDKAHAAGIVHRDLKPENLFLTRREDGSPLVKILDFGISKMAAEASSLTHSDQFLGTPGFMSPEQADSRGADITPRSDLYALGLITFRLLVGRSYWRPGTLSQLLAQILTEPMPPASKRGSTLGDAFDDWFERATHRDVGKRFPSAFEQVEALAAALGLPSKSTPTPSDPRVRTATPSGAHAFAPTLGASAADVSVHKRRTVRGRLLAWGVLAAACVGAAAFTLGGRARHDDRGDLSSATGFSSTTTDPVPSTVASGEIAEPAPATPDAGAAAAPSAVASVKAPEQPSRVLRPRPPAPSSAPPARPKDPLEGQY